MDKTGLGRTCLWPAQCLFQDDLAAACLKGLRIWTGRWTPSTSDLGLGPEHTSRCAHRGQVPGGPRGHTCGVALDMVGTHTGAAAWGPGLTCRRSPDTALALAQGSLAGCGSPTPGRAPSGTAGPGSGPERGQGDSEAKEKEENLPGGLRAPLGGSRSPTGPALSHSAWPAPAPTPSSEGCCDPLPHRREPVILQAGTH